MASEAPHGVVPVALYAKSAAFAPVKVGGIVSDTLDEVLLVTVAYIGAVATPMGWLPKFSVAGETETVGTNGSSATKAFPAALPSVV